MKFKTKYLVKRIFAMALVVAMLWSDSSFVSLAQTIAGDNEESLETILTETEEGEESAPVEDQEEDPVESPMETPAENPTETPVESPTETPAESPEEIPTESPEEAPTESPEEELLPTASPLQDVSEIATAAQEGFSRYTFRVNDPEGQDYDGSFAITASDTIYIYDNEKGKVLQKGDVEKITWTAQAENEETEPYPCGDDGTLYLNHQFFPFEFRLTVKIKLKNGSEEMWLGNIRPDETKEGEAVLEGLTLPGLALCLKEAEGNVEEWNCFFFRADDAEGNNAEYIEGGNLFYDIREEDNGKYIFAKYGVWNESEEKMDCYQTEAVGPVGYAKGEAAGKSNAVLLQKHIDKLSEISKEIKEKLNLNIPDGIYIEAEEPIVISDRVILEGWGAHFTGSFTTKADMGGTVTINGLTITKTGGTVIDASEAPVCLNDCQFSLNNGNLLQVSQKTYEKTELNNCNAEFTSGGSLLSMSGENDSSMPPVFKLGNTHLRVQIKDGNVTMLNAPMGVKWNVDNLEPVDLGSVEKLLPGTPINVINNVFGIDGVPGMVSNSKELTLDSAAYKWISYNLAGGLGCFSDDGTKIIVESDNDPAGRYEVTCLPSGYDAFRPHAVTGTYAAGKGDYNKLLPAGYLTYIVVDVNQKNGFPYGALVGKEIETDLPENFVVMQYHKDKSVETAASVINGEANINYNSALADLSIDENGKCRITVNTYVIDGPVAEPIVLAVYAEVPGANTKLSVYEEEVYYYDDVPDIPMFREVPSDGKILTDGDKTVYFRLNEGIANNALGKDGAFEIVQSGCTVPEGQITSDVSENGAAMTLTIPEGTYGTLTVKAHYQGSASAKATDFTYTLQITSVGNVKGVTVDYVNSVNSGKQYYGTAAFDVLGSEAKPFLGVKSQNGEESRYNLKIISSSLSGKSVTVQYMLDLRDDEAWDSFVQNPPYLLVETVAGTWEIPFEASGTDKLSKDAGGVRYLFDIEDNNEAVFTGALIIDGGEYYRGETQLDIPEEVEGYTVAAMAEGCLNNIYENGIRRYASDIVIIPKTVKDIRGALVTDKSYSNLRQIVVNDANEDYCSYGTWGAFVSGYRDDDAKYCALYKKNSDGTTELIEIASNYEGDLLWRGDAKWTEDTYKLDFSNITGFRWEESNTFPRYEAWGEILVKIETDYEKVTAIKVLEKMGTAAVLPEGITDINAKALEKTAVDTLVLPSTLVSWEGGLTQAKNIYVYNEDTQINPVSGIADSVMGVTFYGFTDNSGNSALKSWVAENSKTRKYKFIAMTESSAAVDYTVNTLRSTVKSSEGIEYYEVRIGEELTETFDFDIVSKVKNGYPGKTDVTVEIERDEPTINDENGKDVGLVTDEFAEEWRDDGSRYYRAVNPGVVKINIKKGDDIVKTVYFAVRPDYYDMMDEQPNWITLGDTQEIYVTAFKWDSETEKNVECVLTEDALKEYEALGVLRVVTPEGRKADSKDAWKIERKTNSNNVATITYEVTPQLRKDSKGNIKGGEGSDFIFELFGDSCSVWIDPVAGGQYDLIPCDDKWNPVMEKKGDTVDIPIVQRSMEGDGFLEYGITFDGKEYAQVSCEVISGSTFVDAEIIKNNDGTASLRLTAKADGKALVRVYTPYADNGDMVLTVSVGANLVESFTLKLWKGAEVLDSSIDPADERYQFVFDLNETDDDGKYVWEHIIPISDIKNTTGEPEPLPSNKLKWTVSDPGLAELVKDDPSDKNQVTGIKLKGEGTVLIIATVNDTNAAAISMLFTVRDLKPRLYNDSAALDIYKVYGTAEYTFALPDGVKINRAGIESVILNKKGNTDDISGLFDCIGYRDKVSFSIRNLYDNDPPASGTYNLKFKVYTTYEDPEGENGLQDLEPYEYTVSLQIGGTAPKVTVTSTDTIDLSVPSKRESALTVKVGDVVNGGDTEITLDTTDATTNSFSQYFELKRNEEGVYSVIFKDANGKPPAEIVKLFNNKKIKLTVESESYRNCPKTAEVSLKITAATPSIKVNGGGKVTVNTADFATFDGNAYTSGLSYTLTEGYDLLSNEDGSIDMVIADKQKAYEDQIDFWQAGEEILVAVGPGVPKGTYTFTWEPKVKAYTTETVTMGPDEDGEIKTEERNIEDTFFEHSLKKQTISVVVTTSAAKATLSSSKLTVNTNYRFTEEETCLQFDESQIQTLYGPSCWMECFDGDWIKDSITLVKGPNGITEENSRITFEVYDNRICVSAEEGAAAGEYKYSVTPYVVVGTNAEVQEGDWQDILAPMALTPINFSVQVTDTLPVASLAQSTVTIDNNDLSSRVLIKWNIKGNYQYVVGPWDDGGNDEPGEDGEDIDFSEYARYSGEDEYQFIYTCENGPAVYLEGDDIRVQATESTLKGTYKFTIAPQVVLDTKWDEVEEKVTEKNIQELAPVTLTVKVNSTRPAVKLEKGTLTVNSSYPGEEDINEYGMFENVPAEAVTEISTSNGYGIGDIEVVPADAKAKAIQDNDETAITFSEGKYPDSNDIYCFAAIPTTATPNGTYNYLVYAWLYGEDEEGNPIRRGAALEPVKLKVTVKNEKPKLQLSTSSILLPAGREGCADITLQGQTEFVSSIAERTEYLVNIGGKWQLTDDETDGAYVKLETAEDGSITVTSLGKPDAVNKAMVTYTQAICLIGNTESYDASYQLTFNLTSADPAVVLSAKTITVNKNFDEWAQEGNQVKLTLNNGEKIAWYDIDDTNAGTKQNVIRLAQIDEESDEYGITYRAYFAKPDKVVKGSYTFNLTPYVIGADGEDKALSPVKLTVNITDTLPTVSASQTKVTINKLDTRGNTWQFIHLKPSISCEEVRYDVAVTKGPKGVDLLDISFCPAGWDICDEADLILGSVDSEIPDGAYTVTVTPYTWVNGERKDLKSINIAVTVNSPKITAALQAPKVTIDVATEGNVYTRNSILLTGTNADMVSNIYWDWELTKKPKGAEEELWIEDRWQEEEETDGKEFAICWGDRRADDKHVNVTPGTYEFTLTPSGLETCDGEVHLPIPGAMKLTVTVKNSMPAVKYGKTASKMNMAFMNEDNTFIALSDTSWHFEYVDAVMTSWPKGAGEEDRSGLKIDFEGDRLKVRGSEKVPEGSYTFTLEPHAKKNGIEMPLKEQKYTVTVKNEIPTAKAASGKLTCNMLYTGKYLFEENPEDNFNKKQQTKLTLSKNYGSSHFEDVKIAFTGKAAQQAEADKFDWRFYPDDGIIAVSLREGRVANNGSYSFEITPVIRGDLTGVKMTLKPVKITVAVENKAIKATAKASGKIDLLNRDESGITYNVTLSDKDADIIEWIDIEPPEKGNNESWRFWLEQDEEDPAKCIVRAKNGEEFSTKVNYEMRLAVHTIYGKTYYVPVKIKPTQSKLTAKSDVTAVTLFKQGSSDTAAVAEIKASINNTPSGEMHILCTEEGELVTSNTDFRVYMLERDEDSKSAKVKIQFASEQAKSKYKAGSKVTLPIYVNVFNQATDTYNTVKVNMTVNIKN